MESAGLGKVFSVNADGSGYLVIHSFSPDGLNGRIPQNILHGTDGKLYGTTLRGGSADAGVVFSVSTDGSDFAVIRSFALTGSRHPGLLIEARDGNLYGTTSSGGTFEAGSMYGMEKTGTGYVMLHDFQFYKPGNGAAATAFIQGSDGALYGSTAYGGDLNLGTVFRLIPRPELKLTPVPSAAPHIRVTTMVSRPLAVQASSDLLNWIEIASGQPTNGEFHAQEPDTFPPQRFYRALMK